jgi:DNA primase
MTLQIKKDYRKGKVLLDIYRNRQSQTIVAAYSVRGLPGAPVSTPLHWEELDSLESPKVFDLHSVPQRVMQNGDPVGSVRRLRDADSHGKKETKRSAPTHLATKRAPSPRPSPPMGRECPAG